MALASNMQSLGMNLPRPSIIIAAVFAQLVPRTKGNDLHYRSDGGLAGNTGIVA